MNNTTDTSPTRHPKIVEDEKAIEVVLRLEETAPAKDNSPNNGGGGGGGRRLTVTTIGSRVSWDATKNPRNSRGSRTSNAASVSVTPGVGGGEIANPPRVLLLQRLPSTAESEHEGGDGKPRPRPRPVSGLPNVYADVPLELARTETVDFAATTGTTPL